MPERTTIIKHLKRCGIIWHTLYMPGIPNGDQLPARTAVKPGDNHPDMLIIGTQSKSGKVSNVERYQFPDRFYKNAR